jgi:hypothetical protein
MKNETTTYLQAIKIMLLVSGCMVLSKVYAAEESIEGVW